MRMEGRRDGGDQHFVSGMFDGYESRSGSENLDALSGDDTNITPDEGRRAPKRKKYHRHTPQQIQELESFYKECPHPDEKQRLELGWRLNLETRQVKFWFQNRRTQMKNQIERHENMLLKKENDKLRFEQATMKNALRNPICVNCGGQVIVPEVPYTEQSLKVENERLKEELTRICLLTEKFLGRPISSIASSIAQRTTSSLDFSLGHIGYEGLNPLSYDMSLMGSASSLPEATPLDRPLILQLAVAAMDEFIKMATATDSLWSISPSGGKEVLNFDEYVATFPPIIGPKPNNFISEASRETRLIGVNSLELVETFMDVDQWVHMFPSLVARASTMNVISPGINGTSNGIIQLIQAELQVLSPLVPLRQVKFLRFCMKHDDVKWAVVDLSIDAVHESSTALPPFSLCRRLPSGCLIQAMPDGCSKVTWMEHTQYDESVVHPLYRRLIISGMGFGARRWLASLQRQCDSLAAITETSSGMMTPGGQKSMLQLARRMTDNFCSGVCASLISKWERLNPGNIGEESVQLMSRKTMDSPGEPSGIVLSATASVWMSVRRQRLFDFLRDKRFRSDWDILSDGGDIQEIACISKGQDPGNCVTLLRCDTSSPGQEMLILQETWTDSTASLVVYAPVDTPAIQSVLSGGDSTYVALLPSGFAIYPDPETQENITNGSESHGCLLTAGFQILVNELPSAKLTADSVTTVEHLIHCTIEKIHQALNCSAAISKSLVRS